MGVVVATVLGLSIFAGLICFVFKIVYWDWLKIPIGLGGGLFFIAVVPLTFVLSIPYSLVVVRALAPKPRRSAPMSFLIYFGIGAIAIVILVSITFPCELEPYFMGGYLFKLLLGA